MKSKLIVAQGHKETSAIANERVYTAIAELSAVQLLRLGSYARQQLFTLAGKARGRTSEDLLQEAIVSTLSGSRMWRQGVDMVQHLRGAMRSIATSWRQAHGEEYPESDLARSGNCPFEQLRTEADYERRFFAQQTLEQIKKIFGNDLLALGVIDCLARGYSRKQGQLYLMISELEYAAALRRVRRKVSVLLDTTRLQLR